MGIREENRERYPSNWNEVVEAIRARSGNRCEKCGIPRGAWRLTLPGGGDVVFVPGPTDELTPEQRSLLHAAIDLGAKATKRPIRLTTAHLDHTAENCDLENLRHWCERCHNGYDAKMRAQGIKVRRDSARR
jgi:hypothetical protein